VFSHVADPMCALVFLSGRSHVYTSSF
jgi:hypothetical protein